MSREGSIVDRAGERLGRHRGAHAYTVGQRHGLGLGGREPLYVLSTDPRANTVTVGPREALLTRSVTVRDVTLRCPGARVDAIKVRSRGRRHPCRLAVELGPGVHADVEVELGEPIERTAPGQIACLYAGDVILGYGTVAD
jgi:tRNA-specific 2-thiouridylase